MDNDYNMSSVPLLSVDEHILMPIATMGSGHLLREPQQQQQQEQELSELSGTANDGSTSSNINHHHDEDDETTTTTLTTHLEGSGGGGGEVTHSDMGNYFAENDNMNDLHAELVNASEILQHSQPTTLEEHEPHKMQDISECTKIQPTIAEKPDEETMEEEPDNVVDAEDDADEMGEDEVAQGDEEEVEEVMEQDESIEEEEIIPDNDVDESLKKQTPEEIIPDNDADADADLLVETKPLTQTDEQQLQPEKSPDGDLAKAQDEASNHTDPPQDSSQTKESSRAESEQPMSSKRASQKKKEEDVDENQCRVCCTKEDLVSIFKKIEGKTGAEMLMTICPSVSIAVKDFLPQFVCHICMGKVMLALKLKQQVETTEKELRKKLSRHKNKVRRPAGYVVIDAPLDSDPASDDEANNDEEFKVSDIASATASGESDSSVYSDSKKKRTRGRKRRKSAVTTPTPTLKTKSKSGKSENGSSECDDDGDPIGNHKRKRSSNSSPETFPCEDCDQIFARKQSLVLHRKVHSSDREPIACRVCGKKFKVKGAYRTHMEKHREEADAYKCRNCSSKFGSRGELKRHMAEEHNNSVIMNQCFKCKRDFASASRLVKHVQNHCRRGNHRQNVEAAGKSRKPEIETFVVGKDLFKSVAPLTTTYWSDSFSD